MKKKLFLAALAAVLVASLVITGTLMLLRDASGTATNTVSFTNLDITLLEKSGNDTDGDAEDWEEVEGLSWREWDQGDEVDKQTKAVNNTATDAYLRIEASITVECWIMIEDEEESSPTFGEMIPVRDTAKEAAVCAFVQQAVLAAAVSDFVWVGSAVGDDPFSGYFYYGAGAPGAITLATFAGNGEALLLNGGLSFDSTELDLAGADVSIILTAQAVQIANNPFINGTGNEAGAGW
ncbi:MAG: hypothetical protein FWE80_02665 [Oscillospiraceae bacterium]|nr:hypothetical protein [Oscillospiraceae bacterium]